MNFTFIGDGIDAMIIDNTFDDQDVISIKRELEYLTDERFLLPPEYTQSARLDGVIQKENSALFLDYVYRDMKYSPILSSGKKVFTSDIVHRELIKNNSMFKIFKYLNSCSTMMSYYQEGGYYKKHKDGSVVTILSYFFKEPKQFNGGSIILHSDDGSKKVEIEMKNNRSIILTSCTDHEVTPITMESDHEKYSGFGRYCISYFLTTAEHAAT